MPLTSQIDQNSWSESQANRLNKVLTDLIAVELQGLIALITKN